MKRCIIFLGKTGSGKDTQAELLTKEFGFSVLRMGDIVRQHAKTDPVLAAQLEAGQLVDNEKVDGFVANVVARLSSDSVFISDGYPRHIEQAHKFEEILRANDGEIALVIYFDITDSVARMRLLLRGRDDDTPHAIVERLAEFSRFTQEVVDYFDHKKLLARVDASHLPEQIASNVVTILKEKGI